MVDVGESRVAEELNGDPVKCNEASWGTIGKLDNVSKLKRVTRVMENRRRVWKE